MVKKASMILLLSALLVPAPFASTHDAEVREAAEQGDWPEVIQLLTPKRGQNIEHDFLLARAYLQTERRADALKHLTSMLSLRREERTLRLLQTAGEIFFTQETSQLHSEAVRLLSLLKLQEAQEKLDQALAREPGNTLVLIRLVQVELLTGKLDSAGAHLKELLASAPYSQDARCFAIQLQNLAPDSFQTPALLRRPDHEVPFMFQLEQWKRQGKMEDIRAAVKEVIQLHPGWAHAQSWFLRSGLLGPADAGRVRKLLERNIKQRERFEGEQQREMSRARYLWVGYTHKLPEQPAPAAGAPRP
jgi:tetratricopeptide (TPR) repeat protein